MRLAVFLLALQVTSSTVVLDPPLVDYTVSSWTQSDGLPANAIRALAQDHDGYLWLGTRAGLVRFDGVRFTLWENTSENALPESDVTAVYAARDGSLWIGYGGSGGMSRLKQGRVDVYKPGDGLRSGFVQAILEDREGVIWVGGLGGLSRFDGSRWQAVGARLGLSGDTIYILHQDRHANLWVGSSGGAFLLAPGASRFSPVANAKRREAVVGFSEDASGAMWLGDARGTVENVGIGKVPQPAHVMQGHSSRLIHDSQGNLWIASLRGNGVLRVPQGHAVTEDAGVRRFTVQDGLAGGYISSLLEDREGSIWVGTDGGLSRLSPSIVSSVRDIGAENGGMAVTPDGSVWIANDDTIARFSGRRRTQYTQREGLPGTAITALHTDRRGTLWAAARTGLARFADGRFWNARLGGPDVPRSIQAMADNPRGGLWLLARSGQRFSYDDARVASDPYPPEVDGKVMFAVYTTRDGAVWEGFTDGSLVVYRKDAVKIYSTRDGIAPGSIRAITQDANGTVWVGTSTGLTRFRDGRFASLPLRRIRPGNMVVGIVEDGSGYLWLTTTSGILRLHPEEFEKALDPSHQIQYRFYSASDGLRGFPVRRPYSTAARGGDGLLRFITSSGVSVVEPRRAAAPQPIAVRIENVVIEGRTSRPSEHVPPRTVRIEVLYRALSLADTEKIRFRYMLEGFDGDWVNAGSTRQALYSNLRPGRYRFLVTAGRDDGAWSDPAVWEFLLEPAFYQTSWFYAISTLAVVLAVLVAWQLRQRQIHRQFALVIEERSRMAREIHDTLLQSLVALTLQLDAVSTQSASVPVKEQLTRMRRQVSRYIRETRQSIWDLRSPTLETRHAPAALREAGESLTAGSDVRFEYSLKGDPQWLGPKLDEELLRIGREAISNAVRHAHATVVRLELEFDQEVLRLRVTDDGRGMNGTAAGDETGHHLGLKSMKERAFRIGGQWRMSSHLEAGTTIEVTVPLPSRGDRWA
jgi:ligand-binding sensor domain-containing protein/signal transduction histidine kinase